MTVDRAKIAAQRRRYYEAHREEICAKARAVRAADPESHRESQRRYLERRRRGEDTASAAQRELAEIAAEEARLGLPPVMDAWRRSRTVSLRTIMAAKKKPSGVSDVRWRMELSRRKMVRMAGEAEASFLDHPDVLGWFGVCKNRKGTKKWRTWT